VCVRRTIQRTRVAHDARSHTHNRVRGHIHACIRACRHAKYKHACMPFTYTYLHSSIQHNSIYHAQARSITMYSYEQAMYCTHMSVWSVELWASAAAMCCAPSVPMSFIARLYAHVCVRRTIQRTRVAHDTRSHTHNRVRGHIHVCIHACRHTKYKHACMSFTYTYLHFNAQRNSTYHAQARPTTMYSYEQAMYCTHMSVWSAELWASAAAMCCAPSAPIEFAKRLYAHVCVRKTIQRTRVAHDARSHTYNRVRDCAHARSTSVRRSAEARKGIELGYVRPGALLPAVLPYACDCVSISCTNWCNSFMTLTCQEKSCLLRYGICL
jgi:hypothetical protein